MTFSQRSSNSNLGRNKISSSYQIAPSPQPRSIFKKSDNSKMPPPYIYQSKHEPESKKSGGFLSTMIDGFGFGTGSSVANNVVNRIFNGKTVTQPICEKENKYCDELDKSFRDCMMTYNQDFTACEKVFQEYESCKINNK